uniref:Uncharacterized protein n=1 Tax=Helianthus annuus TaxID=4232 RepID=A0A251VLR7_HELAN
MPFSGNKSAVSGGGGGGSCSPTTVGDDGGSDDSGNRVSLQQPLLFLICFPSDPYFVIFSL